LGVPGTAALPAVVHDLSAGFQHETELVLAFLKASTHSSTAIGFLKCESHWGPQHLVGAAWVAGGHT